jgi:hypothetical protein
MSAIQKLRELMDERGIEHRGSTDCIVHFMDSNGFTAEAWNAPSKKAEDTLLVIACTVTPEQAMTVAFGDAGGRSTVSATPRCADCSRKR